MKSIIRSLYLYYCVAILLLTLKLLGSLIADRDHHLIDNNHDKKNKVIRIEPKLSTPNEVSQAIPSSTISNHDDSLLVSVSFASETNSITGKFKYQVGIRVNEYELVDKIDVLGLRNVYLSDDGSLFDSANFLLPAPISHISCDSNIYEILSHPIMSIDAPEDRNHSIQKVERVKVLFNHSCFGNGSYYMKDNIFHGGHGDVWRAYKLSADGFVNHTTTYIMKRMNITRPYIASCAAREIYFGKYFMTVDVPVTQLIKHFKDDDNIWLIFRDEGMSLHKILYVTTLSSDTSTLVEPSLLWRKLRTTSSGHQLLKGLIHHLISGTAKLHELGIFHRDLKPNNILINTEHDVKLLIGDFSSAINEEILIEGAYGDVGPSVKEETLEYAPPEVLLSIDSDHEIAYDVDNPESYDIWSIGVIFLEMILGTAAVFSIDQRSAALMGRKMRAHRAVDGQSDQHHGDNRERYIMLLAAWADYCIYDPDKHVLDDHLEDYQLSLSRHEHKYQHPHILSSSSSSSSSYGHDGSKKHHRHAGDDHKSCSIDQLQRAILKRDPLGLGFTDRWGLDLIMRLLQFNSHERISASQALQHAYFVGPYHSSIDGSEHATEQDLMAHDMRISSTSCDLTEGGCVEDHHSMRDKLTSAPAGLLASPSTSSILSRSTLKHLKSLLPIASSHPSMMESTSIDHHSHHVVESYEPELPIDPVDHIQFICPTCGRSFHGSWQACHNHLIARNHGDACHYDSQSLPRCLSDHSMLPIDPHSGWCDLQGRRRYIEDYHSISYAQGYHMHSVYDGHFGSRTARFVSKRIHSAFEAALYRYSITTSSISDGRIDQYNISLAENLLTSLNRDRWQSTISVASPDEVVMIEETEIHIPSYIVSDALSSAFAIVDDELTSYMSHDDTSGSTASVVLVFQHHFAIAHVGDSRIIICCDMLGLPIQLTADHTPAIQTEYDAVYDRGGYVIGDVRRGEAMRVNGKLAVTRSLGDSIFEGIISPVPDVLILSLHGINQHNSAQYHNHSHDGDTKNACMRYADMVDRLYGDLMNDDVYRHHRPLFMIMASDGLWDVISNEEASMIMCSYLLNALSGYDVDSARIASRHLPVNLMQQVAKHLAIEGYIRGSTDNIGVATIDLLFPSSS